MDQGSLLFATNMDSAFTADDENDIRITCPDYALRKRKFTMCMLINKEEGHSRDDHVSLACKVSPNGCIKVVHELAYSCRVPMHVQKNEWFGTTTITQLAEKCAQRAKYRHNGLGFFR